jgi:hypothetical protein
VNELLAAIEVDQRATENGGPPAFFFIYWLIYVEQRPVFAGPLTPSGLQAKIIFRESRHLV